MFLWHLNSKHWNGATIQCDQSSKQMNVNSFFHSNSILYCSYDVQCNSELLFLQNHVYSWLFCLVLGQAGDVFVFQDLRRLLLRLLQQQRVGDHGSGHALDGDGHRCWVHAGEGTEELPGHPLSRAALLPVHQQNPVSRREQSWVSVCANNFEQCSLFSICILTNKEN